MERLGWYEGIPYFAVYPDKLCIDRSSSGIAEIVQHRGRYMAPVVAYLR
jgi:hypothetical protein